MSIPLPQSHQIPVRRPHNPTVPFQAHASWAKIEDHHRLRDTAKHWDAFDTTKLSHVDTRYHELEDRGRRLRQVDLSEYHYRDNGVSWPPHPLIKKADQAKSQLLDQHGEATNASGEKLRGLKGDDCTSSRKSPGTAPPPSRPRRSRLRSAGRAASARATTRLRTTRCCLQTGSGSRTTGQRQAAGPRSRSHCVGGSRRACVRATTRASRTPSTR